MTGITQNQKGQNLIEYAIIVAVITAAMVAMSTYVYRSVQATQKVIQDGYTQ
jgi:Flp pilus assembly pilin Flp